MREFPSAAFAIAMFAVAACGTRTDLLSAGDLTGDSGSTPANAGQCTWPASLDSPLHGSSAPHCSAAPALLRCNTPDGGVNACLSNDPGCSDGGGTSCMNECANNEYAVGCYPPPFLDAGTAPNPPSTCRLLDGHSAWYCCPCGQ